MHWKNVDTLAKISDSLTTLNMSYDVIDNEKAACARHAKDYVVNRNSADWVCCV